MARVRDAEARVLQRLSLDYPIEAAANEAGLLNSQRVVWTSHLHLAPGRYQLECAAQDTLSSRAGVRRLDFEVPSPSPAGGLRMSSVSMLQADSALPKDDATVDNPLEYQGHQRELATLERR